MKLTKTDKLIIDSYAVMMESLSAYLGSAYEISLHSLEDYNHSVVKIMNGYHSGRSVGAPLTDLALNMLKRIEDEGLSSSTSYTVYHAVNSAGERLKPSTIPVLGENGRIIGMLCINFYMDTPLSEIMQSLTDTRTMQTEREHFASSITDGISTAVADARAQVMNDPTIPAVNKNKELIRILHDKGIFHIKDSVVEVAKALGISKNTVYLHLRGIGK
ncbi:MAG: PAS domain-containing protein [Oscillospiraceae bacterium]|nr:PAS domain-containing protein [Oscillospiraceae bacterium]